MPFLAPIGAFLGSTAGALTVAGIGQLAGGILGNQAAERGTNRARADLAPFREAGLSAMSRYQDLLRDPSSVKDTPGYQFRLQEGLENVMGGQSAGGKLFSGETGKGLLEYGQNYATAEYDKSLQRELSLAQLGQASAAGQASASLQGAATAQNAYGAIGEGLGSIGSAYGFGKYLEN